MIMVLFLNDLSKMVRHSTESGRRENVRRGKGGMI